MADAPERIWAECGAQDDEWPTDCQCGEWEASKDGIGWRGQHEYIRADLVPRWQPIETAPKDNSARLVWCPGNLCTYNVSWNDQWRGWQVFGDAKIILEAPTHWMPLPEPPDAD